MAVLEEVARLTRAWNSNALEWITALYDPDVSLAEFNEVSLATVQSQAAVVAGFRIAVSGLPEGDLQEAFDPIVHHYQARFDALHLLIAASMGSSERAFEDALSAYQDKSNPNAAGNLLRTVFEHPSVMRLLEYDTEVNGLTATPQEVVDALVRTMSGG